MTEKELLAYLEISKYENVVPLCKRECKVINDLLNYKNNINNLPFHDRKELFEKLFPNDIYQRFEFLFNLDNNELSDRYDYNAKFLSKIEYEYQKNINGFIVSISKQIESQKIELVFHNYNLEGFQPELKEINLHRFDVNKVKRIEKFYITNFDEFIQESINNYFENINNHLRQAFVYKIPKSELN